MGNLPVRPSAILRLLGEDLEAGRGCENEVVEVFTAIEWSNASLPAFTKLPFVLCASVPELVPTWMVPGTPDKQCKPPPRLRSSYSAVAKDHSDAPVVLR